MRLIDITDEARNIDKLITEADGDLTGQEQIVDAWLKENKDKLSEKADNYAALITEKEQRAGVRKNESERLAKLVKADMNSAAGMKYLLKQALDAMCIQKLETNRFRISVATNGGKQPIDIYVPDEELPAIYKKEVPASYVADKEAIREALEAGKEVKGAVLQQRGTNLRIR